MGLAVTRLAAADVPAMRAVNALFADAFGDPQSYRSAPPDDSYLARLLSKPECAVLAAAIDDRIVGIIDHQILGIHHVNETVPHQQ